uniref:Zona pellucida sperm-binding protein 3 n=1 Tax=Gopherus evgoodei TaxID=1825980 RepID=A0A8C4Y4C8_9SAUR
WWSPPLLRAVSLLQPVMVQCEEAQLVITVRRDLFGMGQLIKAADLSLGPAACQYTSLNAAENTVTFEAGLHECGSTLQMTPDSLVYSTRLNYNPSPASNPIILRTNPAVIPIECHYPRKDNVSSKAIKPTWVPFSSTLSAEEGLSFSLRLMNGSAERPSNGFQLGEVMLFVDSCVATLTPERNSSPHYTVIDFNGCLVDGRSDDTTSAFIFPRPRQDTLQFMVDVFRFEGDARNLIYITCHLKVNAVEQAPNPLNKACSFNKAGNVSRLEPHWGSDGQPREEHFPVDDCPCSVAAGLQWKAPETSAGAVRLGTVGWLDSLGESDLWTDGQGGTSREMWPPGIVGSVPTSPGKMSGLLQQTVPRESSTQNGMDETNLTFIGALVVLLFPNTGDPLVREAETDVVVGPLVILDAYQGSRDLSTDQMAVEKAASEGK